MEMSLSESNRDGLLREYARKYNDPVYFTEDPIIFPKRFLELEKRGEACRKDIEVAAVISSHLAWGRRNMIVRDCTRAFDEMGWKPYDYVMKGEYRSEPVSLHRTVMWSEFAAVCFRLRGLYEESDTLEYLTADSFRTDVFGQKSEPKAANKKIHMMRRWMVRRDGKVDLGIWRDTDPKELIIPLDTHVHAQALSFGLTSRRQADARTAAEITQHFRKIFPDDPCLGDFALFGSGLAAGK